MSKIKMDIWGRTFELEIEYDCYSGEKVLPIQEMAAEKLISNSKTVDSALEKVKEYCVQNNPDEMRGKQIDNIFKYVIPRYLFIKRSESKRVVAIMCNYKYDMENGIAIVFENETFLEIGSQDIIL